MIYKDEIVQYCRNNLPRPLSIFITGDFMYGIEPSHTYTNICTIFQTSTISLLPIRKPSHSISLPLKEDDDCSFKVDGIEIEHVIEEILKGNISMVELLHSNYPLLKGDYLDTLKALSQGSITQKTVNNYLSSINKKLKKYENTLLARDLLYAYRESLTLKCLITSSTISIDLLSLRFFDPEDYLNYLNRNISSIVPFDISKNIMKSLNSSLDLAISAIGQFPISCPEEILSKFDDLLLELRLNYI